MRSLGSLAIDCGIQGNIKADNLATSCFVSSGLFCRIPEYAFRILLETSKTSMVECN